MSYIVVAEACLDVEENHSADKDAVLVPLLSERDSVVKFYVRGDFGRQKEITMDLATKMVNAGFYSFEIHHSY